MERKQTVKVESTVGSPSFPDHVPVIYPLQGVFDYCEGEKSSVGFMELLGMQDYGPSLFDMLQGQSSMGQVSTQGQTATKEFSEVLNQPATPNSSSISSASSEAMNDEQVKADEQEEDQQKTKKQLKPKKTNQKKKREPRFAFMTKSEVDHLEDGYRWRKYGQKAVKNSPFPRSYYRCTTASCNVKKRVERSFSDPSIVVTTYEGQHTHPSPVMPRPSLSDVAPDSGHSVGVASTFSPLQRTLLYQYQQQQQQQQHPFLNTLSPSFGFGNYTGSTNAGFHLERRFCTPGPTTLLQDHGLLQDIVPSHMLKQE